MTITRIRIRCREKDCPKREDEEFHRPVCYAIEGVEHSSEAQHQHHPKRSQGGKRVVVVLCSYCHDKIDNGPWGNAVEDGVYRIWDVHGETLLRVSSDGGKAGRDFAISPVPEVLATDGANATLPPSPDVRAPTAEAGDQVKPLHGGHAPSPSAAGAGAIAGDAPSNADLSRPAAVTRSSDLPGGDGLAPNSTTSPPPISADDPGRVAGGFRTGITSTPAAVTPPRIAESLLPNGLELPAEFTFEDWTDLAGMVAGMNRNRQWWAGDLVLAGERFGERATQFWNDLGYKWESLSNAVRVCRRFPRPLRHESLQFSHHAVVYALDESEAEEYLIQASDFGWTVAQLRKEVHGVKVKTVRYTLQELRERLAEWPGDVSVRNNARRWAEAWLVWLDRTEAVDDKPKGRV